MSCEMIGNVKMDYTYYDGVELYEDGSEKQLLDIVKTYKASEYNRIIAQKKEWPILYHLSEERGNIIEWLPMSKDESVLEIGSGCGAITGVLADKAGEVDCIELAKQRSLVNAYRNQDKDNICIYVGNFQTIEPKLEKKYDYITLIGVFEYAASYIQSENPYEEFLKIVAGHLKKDGKLIIAIENKFGLKYWAGCKEDHLGRYFAGIEGYDATSHVRTFSKKELIGLAKKTGLGKYEFYYPYPDYKLPTTIFSDQRLPRKGELCDNKRNFDAERLELFDETKVYDQLIEDGMFDYFSNSYLLVLKKDGE